LPLGRRTREDAQRPADRSIGVETGAPALHNWNDNRTQKDTHQKDAHDGDGRPDTPRLIENMGIGRKALV
jgi:hypothetical protein